MYWRRIIYQICSTLKFDEYLAMKFVCSEFFCCLRFTVTKLNYMIQWLFGKWLADVSYVILKWDLVPFFMLCCMRWKKLCVWIIILFVLFAFDPIPRSQLTKFCSFFFFIKFYERNERDIWHSLFRSTNERTNIAVTITATTAAAVLLSSSWSSRPPPPHNFFVLDFFFLRIRICFRYCFPAYAYTHICILSWLAFSLFPYSNVKTCLLKFPVFKSTCLPFDWIVNKFLQNSLAVFVVNVISILFILFVWCWDHRMVWFLVKLACVSVFSCLEYTNT